ncbi:TPA: LysR substrate-binding domain-containing protein [Photobacterium damselae]
MKNFDVNLLKVLEVLLQEKSVTAAACRLHLSQSAVSKQLAKLRETFHDPLFERAPHGLRPTPKALSLAPNIHQILRQVEQLTRPEDFDPASSRRKFYIDLVETAYTLTYPDFIPKMLEQAPEVSLISRTWNDDSLNQLLRCEIDLGIGIFEWDERSEMHYRTIPNELNYYLLGRDYPVCLMRKDHPSLQEEWNLETFLKYRHIEVSIGGLRRWLLEEVLALQNRHVDIAINMTDFRTAIKLCENSDLLMCYPSYPTHELQETSNLIVRPIPIHLDAGGYVLLWHRHFELDLSHQWLRELIIHGVKKLD